MRHRLSGKKLGRNIKQRRALKRSLIASLILSGSIKTTAAKAKFIQPSVDKLISDVKKGGLAGRRRAQSLIQDPATFNKLMIDIVPKLVSTSGFTRRVNIGFRQGDAARMSQIEFVFNKNEKT